MRLLNFKIFLFLHCLQLRVWLGHWCLFTFSALYFSLLHNRINNIRCCLMLFSKFFFFQKLIKINLINKLRLLWRDYTKKGMRFPNIASRNEFDSDLPRSWTYFPQFSFFRENNYCNRFSRRPKPLDFIFRIFYLPRAEKSTV